MEHLDQAFLDWMNEMVPPMKKTQSQPTSAAIYQRMHYKRHAREIRLRKLLIDIAVKGRVPSLETIKDVEADRAEIIRAWMQFRKSGKFISVNKQQKMRQLLYTFI